MGAFIPWLPPHGRKAIALHREGCILLKAAFLTRRSPPRFLFSRPLLIPLGPRGGNRSAVTSPGGTAPSLLLSLHCTNTISMYLTLSDYPVWGCYLFFCRDSDSPLRTYSPFYLLQILLSFLPFKNITTESCKCFPEREAHGDESKMRKTEQKWNLGTRGWSQMQPQCATVIKICRQRIRTCP